MYVKRNTGVRSRNHCCREKAVRDKSVCVSVCARIALVTQHVKGHSSLAVPHSSTLFHKRHDVRKKGIEGQARV